MSQPTHIFMVRHGQTLWNTQHRLQGHQDSPLTELGKQQAIEARASLKPYEIHKAYVSPLQRAMDTSALILAGREIEVVPTLGLKEIRLGPWEGKTKVETALSHPSAYQQFWEAQDQFKLTGAETYQQLQARVVAALETIFLKEKGKNILVVSHWIAIKVALAHYSLTPLHRLSDLPDPQNGAFSVLCDQSSPFNMT